MNKGPRFLANLRKKKEEAEEETKEEPKEPTEETTEEEAEEETKEEPPKQGLVSKIDELSEKFDTLTNKKLMDKKQKEKMKRLPFGVRAQLKNLAKQNKILVFYLKRNRNLKMIVADIKDSFVIVEGKPHNISNEFVYLYLGKFPCVVICEWDINPVGTEAYYEAVKEGRAIDPALLIIDIIERGAELTKKKLQPKVMLIIGVVACIVGYLMFAGGK